MSPQASCLIFLRLSVVSFYVIGLIIVPTRASPGLLAFISPPRTPPFCVTPTGCLAQAPRCQLGSANERWEEGRHHQGISPSLSALETFSGSCCLSSQRAPSCGPSFHKPQNSPELSTVTPTYRLANRGSPQLRILQGRTCL